MVNFNTYLKDVLSQLECNATEDDKKNFIVYTYSEEQVNNNLDYFEKCFNDNLSAYKALLFFNDYLEQNIFKTSPMYKEICKIKHSESKTAWNIVGTRFGDKYKIARLPYYDYGKGLENLTRKDYEETYNDADFICKCLNNKEYVKKCLSNDNFEKIYNLIK